MRADISSPCDPSLPNGIPNTPGRSSSSSSISSSTSNNSGNSSSNSSSAHPHRRRKHGSHRIRHLINTPPGLPHLILQPHPFGGDNSTMDQQQYGYGYPPPPVPVTDPRTQQEKKELLEYFQKLRVLVPSLPKTGKIPKLDVIEHVITYIKQLENQLIDHPMIQVLENNAYISGLLQSMAPEFDVSHLFPTRSQHQQLLGTTDNPLSPLDPASNNSNSSANNSAFTHQYNHSHHQQQQQQSRLESSYEQLPRRSQSYQHEVYRDEVVPAFSAGSADLVPHFPSVLPKLKNRKASTRKPLSILSSTNPTK